MRTKWDPEGKVTQAKPLRDLRILVADDELFIAMDLETTLSDAGAEVVGPYTTAADALRATEEPLSAAILDIRLGQETTEDIANRLAKNSVPFLFYSGQILTGAMEVHREAPLLSKPCEPRVLVEAVSRLLGRAAVVQREPDAK